MPRIVVRSSVKLLLGAATLALLAGCVDKSPATQLDWGVYNHGWPNSGQVDTPPAQTDTQYSQSRQDQTFQVAQNSDNDPTPPPPVNYHAPDQDGVQVSSLGTVQQNNGQPTEAEYANAPIHREKPTGTELPHSPYAQKSTSAPRSLTKPGTAEQLQQEAAREAAARAAPKTTEKVKKTEKVEKVAKAEPAPKPEKVTRVAKAEPAPTAADVRKKLQASEGMPSFRWPVKGQILSRFGEKEGGTENDGINIATREGDPIHAAAAGIVEYAGNGIAGYGNLVLIRHKGHYFTAYAHADRLNVRKGDTIRAGQVIGYAGTSGDVKAPQLHFEIRHGKTPLDPTRFLGATGHS